MAGDPPWKYIDWRCNSLALLILFGSGNTHSEPDYLGLLRYSRMFAVLSILSLAASIVALGFLPDSCTVLLGRT
jgi:hypothetical protein